MQDTKVYSNTGVFLGTLPAAKMSYTIKSTPLSTGKLVLPIDDDGNEMCQAYNRVELWDNDERVDLFRVIAMPSSAIKFGGNCTYKLEHVLATLMDNILPGYHEIGGTGVTMADCVRYILSFQSVQRWQLGRCDFNTHFQYSFSSAYLLNALLALPKQLSEDWLLTTDTTTWPWTLNLIRPSANVECELRYKHNMQEIGKTYDASDLCTRCYPYGYGEGVNQLTVRDVNNGQLYIDADTIGTWGVVEKPYANTAIEYPETLLNRARQWMEACKNPRFSYTIKAIDLYALTRESYDRFYPGKLCRVNDQEHGVLVSVRVIQIAKDDPAAKPEDVTITLASSSASIANDIADLASRASINELYAQGATNLFQIPYRDNADKDHPITVDVDIPTECVRVNKLWLLMHIGSFRSSTKGAAGGGGTISTTSAGGAQEITKPVTVNISNNTTGNPKDMDSGYTKSDTSLENGGVQLVTGSGGSHSHTSSGHVHSQNNHQHYFTDTYDLAWGHVHSYTSGNSYTGGISNNTTPKSITIAGYTYENSGSTGSASPSTDSGGSHTHAQQLHTHNMNHYHMLNLVISIPALSIQIGDHIHSLTMPDHTHTDVPGIYDGPSVNAITVTVDGNAVPTAAISGGEVDLIPYLGKDGAGKVLRGSHTITLTPVATESNTNGLCKVTGNVSAVVFIRSQGGGDY